MRRLRRVCRPLLPIVIRALIVTLTATELKPAIETHDGIAMILSRLGVVAGILSALLSVIFFDVRAFNFVTVGAVCVHFALRAIEMGVGVDGDKRKVGLGSEMMKQVGVSQRMNVIRIGAFMCFHSTAILFSTLVGRRRSICKPSALRAAAAARKRAYFGSLKEVRHVDVLEAGTRLQACILALDYALARSARSSVFLLTLPFAALFLAGYATRRNGAVLLMLLLGLAAATDRSPLLGFNFAKTVSTVSSALLGLAVGPGLLTVDEWLATANQLCY